MLKTAYKRKVKLKLSAIRNLQQVYGVATIRSHFCTRTYARRKENHAATSHQNPSQTQIERNLGNLPGMHRAAPSDAVAGGERVLHRIVRLPCTL